MTYYLIGIERDRTISNYLKVSDKLSRRESDIYGKEIVVTSQEVLLYFFGRHAKTPTKNKLLIPSGTMLLAVDGRLEHMTRTETTDVLLPPPNNRIWYDTIKEISR